LAIGVTVFTTSLLNRGGCSRNIGSIAETRNVISLSRHDNVTRLGVTVKPIALRRPISPVCSYETAQNRIDLVLNGLCGTSGRHTGKFRPECRFHLRQPVKHESSETPELSRSFVSRAALVFHDLLESEEAYCRGVRVHFDLEAPLLPRMNGSTVPEAAVLQNAAESNHVGSKRSAQVCGVASSVKAMEVPVQLTFCQADANLVLDNKGSVNRHYGICTPDFSVNPVQDLACLFQPRYTA
jgi:hypothetical protein